VVAAEVAVAVAPAPLASRALSLVRESSKRTDMVQSALVAVRAVAVVVAVVVMRELAPGASMSAMMALAGLMRAPSAEVLARATGALRERRPPLLRLLRRSRTCPLLTHLLRSPLLRPLPPRKRRRSKSPSRSTRP
jgi:hypothetical protein